MAGTSVCSTMAWPLAVIIVASGTGVAGQVGGAVVYPNQLWQTATPEQVGMDAAMLAQAKDYAVAGGGSGMLTRHGELVMRWGDQTQAYDLKSSTKAIGVTAVGLALADSEFVSLNDPATKDHPEFGTPPEANRDKSWLKKITLLHLATQTAGFDKAGGFTEPLFEPGTKWAYSDGGPNWLAECVTLAYRQDLQELMFARMFSLIGIGRDDLKWRANAYRPKEIDGVARREFGSGISDNVDAMARIGCLYLCQGRWGDKQILRSSFVDAVRAVPYGIRGLAVVKPDEYGNASDRYGLLWWNNADGAMKDVPRDAYWSWGLYDSPIVATPSLDIVIARVGESMTDRRNPHCAPIESFLSPVAQSVEDRGKWPGAPYPASEIITSIEWAPIDTIARKAAGSDNWPITWADDDTQYSAYGDGWGFEPKADRKLSLGLARITGGPESFEGINIVSRTIESLGDDKAGPKASGMLCVNGILYMLVRNVGNSQIAWSDDHGESWSRCNWRFETSFGAPTFLNFGKDYAGRRDDFVYVYSHDNDSAYASADRMVLARVPMGRIRDRNAYEFLKGLDAQGRPLWTGNIQDRDAVFVNHSRCYRSGITYNAGLKRYLWCQILPFSADNRGPRFQGGFGIYEAAEPWGPWRTVFYTETWDTGPGETSTFPAKWMSQDGRTCYLLFSGNDCFSLRKATLR